MISRFSYHFFMPGPLELRRWNIYVLYVRARSFFTRNHFCAWWRVPTIILSNSLLATCRRGRRFRSVDLPRFNNVDSIALPGSIPRPDSNSHPNEISSVINVALQQLPVVFRAHYRRKRQSEGTADAPQGIFIRTNFSMQHITKFWSICCFITLC